MAYRLLGFVGHKILKLDLCPLVIEVRRLGP
jgi:hypothetical protein